MAADPLSLVFSALADPTRRDMVARLAVADATVNELAEPYDVTVQAVSKHLKVLKDAGLVSRSQEAQRRPVHLEAEVFNLMTKWIERYRLQAEERYRRLDDVLTAMPDEVEPDEETSAHSVARPPRSQAAQPTHGSTNPDQRMPTTPDGSVNR
jgi:DNA-binding transcriptional ArsR family regulator